MTAKDAWSLTKQTFNDWSEDKASRLAAALAYYAVFSLAPILVLAVVIAGFVLQNNERAESQVVQQMSQLVSGVSQEQAQGWIDAAKKSGGAWWATAFSLLLLIWSASNVFAELQDSMNTIWEVQPKPDAGWWEWFRKRFLSVAMVFGIIFLLLVSLVVSTIITAFTGSVMEVIGLGGSGWFARTVMFVVDVLVSLGVLTVLFGAVYKYLPDVRISWRDVLVGALVTAVLFTVGRYALSMYFRFAAPTSSFGAAGSLAALLLWVYYSSSILFLGAEFTQAYARRFGTSIQPDTYAVPMDEETVRKHKKPTHRSGPRHAQPSGQGRAPDRGFRPPAISPPAIVRIDRPVPDAGLGKLVAASGVAAGVAIGAASLLAKRFIGPRFEDKAVAQRLNDLEDRLAHEHALQRYGSQVDLRHRLSDLQQRIQQVGHSAPRPRAVREVQIHERLNDIEHQFAIDHGLRKYGQHVAVEKRIDHVESRLRDLSRAHRRATSPLPRWLQRLGEFVTGQ